MPQTIVRYYCEADGSIPFEDWLLELRKTKRHEYKKCLFLIELLKDFGRDLRRPRADYLRDGVYELRSEARGVNYRLLYGFVSQNVTVISHGFTKEKKVPDTEIELAIVRLERSRHNPGVHQTTFEVDDEENFDSRP